MMEKIFTFICIFLIGETIASGIFYLIRKAFDIDKGKEKEKYQIFRMILIGLLERLVLFIASIYGIITIYVLFGALKVATRLQPEGNVVKKSNDYFLIGNLASVLFSLLYYVFYVFNCG